MYVTAAEIARANGIDPKRYRQALRDASFSWYVWGSPWTVEAGSAKHEDLLRVLRSITGSGRVAALTSMTRAPIQNLRGNSDEAYILDLCDGVLGKEAIRQHCFDFLRGDPGKFGSCKMLPVDAWYPELALVIEYRERQHSEAVKFFDQRETVSGVGRGEQRRI